MLAQVQQIADCPLPAPTPCDEAHLERALRSLSILPRRADDETTGELRAKLYARLLQHLPREAISFVTEHGLREWKFFPTVSEILTLAERWKRDDWATRAKAKAEARVQRERWARYDDAITALKARSMPQADLAMLPERWLRIASELGYVRQLADGSWMIWPDIDRMDPDQRADWRERVSGMIADGQL